jgi:hypothetical protein
VSWKTFDRAIELLRKRGVPSRLEPHTLGLSEPSTKQLFATLRLLELITADDEPSLALRRLVTGETEPLRAALEKLYPDVAAASSAGDPPAVDALMQALSLPESAAARFRAFLVGAYASTRPAVNEPTAAPVSGRPRRSTRKTELAARLAEQEASVYLRALELAVGQGDFDTARQLRELLSDLRAEIGER